MVVSIKEIKSAREVIKEEISPTPLIPSKRLNIQNNEIYFKPESLQKTGSFKIRGAFNKMANLTEAEKSKGVIASSAGNHAQGVALAASAYGIQSTIVMPVGAPISKVIATQNYGAQVVLHGKDFDEAYDKAVELQEETGATFVHAFNDEFVIAGQGTIGLEIVEELADVDAIVVPIGGGGLISGIAIAAKTLKPDIKIIGVEAENAASMKESFAADKIIKCTSADTIADGIAVKRPGPLTFALAKKYVDEIVTVTEEEIAQGIFYLMENEKLVTEGAGATATTALLSGKIDLKESKIVVLLSGGNIDMNLVMNIIDSTLIKEGRFTEISISIPDKPGHLQTLLQVIASTKANISTISQTNLKPYLSLGSVEVTLVLETKDNAHIAEIHQVLEEKGYQLLNKNSKNIYGGM